MDMALTLSKLFMRTISQNPNENQTGISLWTLEDIQKAQEKQRELELQAEQQGDDDDYGDGGISDNALMELDIWHLFLLQGSSYPDLFRFSLIHMAHSPGIL